MNPVAMGLDNTRTGHHQQDEYSQYITLDGISENVKFILLGKGAYGKVY